MSNIDNLDSKTDAGLDELFAVEVTGARRTPPFCADANAVLPWLEKCAEVSSVFEDGSWFVGIEEKPASHTSFVCASSLTFARAAVIALLRAKRRRDRERRDAQGKFKARTTQ